MINAEKKDYLLLLTTDLRLEHLIAAEASLADIPLHTERSIAALSGALLQQVKLILWDIDTIPPVVLSEKVCPIIGITKKDAPLPSAFSRLLRHPIAMDRLRGELTHVFYEGKRVGVDEDHPKIDIRIAADGKTLLVNGVPFLLTDKEIVIMKLLLQHRGEPISKQALWQAITDGENDAVSNKVEVYLCHLRRKIEHPLGLRLFSTVRGQGYRLNADI
jgi:hypothetical protein